MKNTKESLESLYQTYNKPEYLKTDPLEFLHLYPCLPDREIVALIASALAYGRVALIRSNVSKVLNAMGPCPSQFLLDSTSAGLSDLFQDFCHRFCKTSHLVALLTTIKNLVETHGSLENAYAQGADPGHETVMPSMESFYHQMGKAGLNGAGHLVPDPVKGSACKRMNLFLRWMVRQDRVDPGGWKCLAPSQLVIPLDVHMGRICRNLGFCSRKQNDIKTALEITSGFRAITPHDPVRYDFALTRASMDIPQDF